MEDMILLTREEAWQILQVLERAVDAAEKAGLEDLDAHAAFRLVARKLLPTCSRTLGPRTLGEA